MGRIRPSGTANAATADLFVDCGSGIMDEVQDAVAATLRKMGICATPMRTILIQRGYFVGHKYSFEGGYAIRLAGKNTIEVYDDDGKLLKTVTLEETDKNDAA